MIIRWRVLKPLFLIFLMAAISMGYDFYTGGKKRVFRTLSVAGRVLANFRLETGSQSVRIRGGALWDNGQHVFISIK
ncbi:hypothetical protein AD948_01930 [Acetobacter senegalensis]|uniref:Uncharacterized protein n=1 Tax=Acetobacter senegalensis TaxID=446692 RepID=A0A149U7D0_9PROT|nr:hypothetical protein AD948_01930 [Acetobacter senegalensis]